MCHSQPRSPADPCPPCERSLTSLSRRQVTREEGAALAASWGKTGFIESSARHNENVSKIFELVVAEIEKDMNPEPEKPPASSCSLM